MTKRRSISKVMRARILHKTKGRCYHETCRVELHNGWIVEHVHPLALGGTDTEDNMMPSCVPCARRKTFGLRQTTHGSDIHAIAKTKRLEKKQRNTREGESGSAREAPADGYRAIPSATVADAVQSTLPRFPKRSIPSRPFPKSLRKRMNGTVERRDG